MPQFTEKSLILRNEAFDSSTVNRHREKLERVKKGLMDELLTGRKRVWIEV